MAIKPSPTIAGKLRKLFNNNKWTIEPAIGDSIPGGRGGGALYANAIVIEINPSKSGTRGGSVDPVPETVMALDKTYKEISDAISSDKIVVLRTLLDQNGDVTRLGYIDIFGFDDGRYFVQGYSSDGVIMFTSETETGVMVINN